MKKLKMKTFKIFIILIFPFKKHLLEQLYFYIF